MKYQVDCRRKIIDDNIEVVLFNGCGFGLPDKKTALKVFNEQIKSGNWDAIYIDKIYKNGTCIDVKTWYKEE